MTDKTKMKSVAAFDIFYLQYLDETSQPTQPLPKFAKDPNTLINFYSQMTLARVVDSKAIKLQRTGRIGTYPASIGQEAVGVGLATALKQEDIYCPYYRESAALLQRGVSIEEILSIWGGDERGNHFKVPKEDLPINIPIATQCLHAAGVAFAIQYRQQPRVVATSLGDGGTSKGDFYEAMNLAGVWNLPLIFVINNNQWAISVPISQQTHARTMAQKSISAGIKSIQVDGNDVIAVHQAAVTAIESARQGKGPAVIEAITYRLCDHTTADDANRYQNSETLTAAWKIEPLSRLRNYLTQQGLWSPEKEEQLQKEILHKVHQAIDLYLSKEKDSSEAMFNSLYENLPAALIDQYEELQKKGGYS